MPDYCPIQPSTGLISGDKDQSYFCVVQSLLSVSKAPDILKRTSSVLAFHALPPLHGCLPGTEQAPNVHDIHQTELMIFIFQESVLFKCNRKVYIDVALLSDNTLELNKH